MADKSCMNIARIVLGVICMLMLITALVLIAIAIIFPSWGIVSTNNSQKLNQIGLWMHCYNTTGLAVGTSTKSTTQCDLKGTAKHIESDFNFNEFQDGEIACLILLCCAFAVAITALLFSYCALCHKWLSLVWSLGSLIAAVLTITGCVLWFLGAQTSENKYMNDRSINSTVVRRVGQMFKLAVAASGILLLEFVLSVAVGILTFYYERRNQDRDMARWTYSEPLRTAPIQSASLFKPEESRPLTFHRDQTIV